MSARRHGLLQALISLALPFAFGAQCIDVPDPVPDEDELKRCEDVCAIEDGCGLRAEADCLAALCDENGFVVVVGEDEDDSDLADLSSTQCIIDAADASDTPCAEVAACSCPDACARVDECTGDPGAGCDDDCLALIEQLPEETYTENRCKMESTCEDIAACGGT